MGMEMQYIQVAPCSENASHIIVTSTRCHKELNNPTHWYQGRYTGRLPHTGISIFRNVGLRKTLVSHDVKNGQLTTYERSLGTRRANQISFHLFYCTGINKK